MLFPWLMIHCEITNGTHAIFLHSYLVDLVNSYRYSIWIDSKMRLNADPLLIIEYFLWRKRSEYSISNHYDRHCVWEEVLQNKRLNKYNHTAIDEQFLFYQSDGLTKFNKSDMNSPLPSCKCHSYFMVEYTCSFLLFVFLRLISFIFYPCSCAWRFIYCACSHAHVKFVFLLMV